MTIPPNDNDGKVKVAIIGRGIPSLRDLWMLEMLEQRIGKEVMIVEYKHLEDRALLANFKQRCLYDQMILDELVDKPTKHEVGTYAAMFGQPAKTYTPPHKAKRRGKRK